MADLIVPISGLPPAGAIIGTEILAIVQGGVTSKLPLSSLPAFFASAEIINTVIIGYLIDSNNWYDSNGNVADIGGVFNNSIDLSSQKTGDYYLQLPSGNIGEIRFKYEILQSGSTLTAIRILYYT